MRRASGVALVLASVVVAVAMPDRSESAETEALASVEFVSPMQAQAAVSWANGHGVTIERMAHEWTFGTGDTVTGGYEVAPGSPDPASAYRLTLASIFTGLAADLAADPRVTAADRQQASDIASQLSSGNAPVAQLNVRATQSEITAMQSDPAVSGTQSLSSSPVSTSEPACIGDWWPLVGRVQTGPLPQAPSYRRVYQWFRWDSARLSRLKCKHSKVTYEAEFWSDNSDRLRYLGHREGFATNLPKAYMDTEAFNPSANELGYTVGTSDARKLVARTNGYYTLLATTQGNYSADRGKVNAQWGFRRWGSWCRNPAWCIYPGGTEPVLPAWGHQMPGSSTWSGSA